MRKLDILNEAEKVKPIMVKDGVKICSYEDARKLVQAEMIDPVPDTGDMKFNPDGTIARTKVTIGAVNPEHVYMNAFEVIKDGQAEGKPTGMIVVAGVTDDAYRALRDKQMGIPCSLSTVPAYEFRRKSKKLVLTKVMTISNTEFNNGFNDRLADEQMAELLPLIGAAGNIKTATEMPI